MDLRRSETLIKVIKEGAFGGTHFWDIYSGADSRWYRKSEKEFYESKNIDGDYYCLNYNDVSINKYGVKCKT